MTAKSLLAQGRGKVPVNGRKRESADALFAKQFPVLNAFMSELVDEEGKDRDVGKVTVFFDGGQVKASLSDPTNTASVYVSCDAVGDVWAALEAVLTSGDADWRAWQGGKAGKGKKRS